MLINCPECNRAGVSDTAKACPGCGFDFEAYYRYKRDVREANYRSRRYEEEQKKQASCDHYFPSKNYRFGYKCAKCGYFVKGCGY